MERALAVTALSENKSGGIGILKRTSTSILNAGFFFLNTSQDDQTQPGKAIVMRYAHSPINFLLKQHIHFGASLSYRFDTDPADTKFKTRPEVATSDDFYVDTSSIDAANKVFRLGLELHKEWKNLSWQTEVLLTEVNRTGLDSLNFWGAYTYLSWFLTNDTRNYNSGSGTFDALTPGNSIGKGGKGAWELAFRASYVDLTDNDVIGGEQSNLTLGLNWYLNRHFRVMGNLTKVLDVKRPGSEFDGLDPLILSVRLQWKML
jgi:phosphate-selective porin OprO/OprP